MCLRRFQNRNLVYGRVTIVLVATIYSTCVEFMIDSLFEHKFLRICFFLFYVLLFLTIVNIIVFILWLLFLLYFFGCCFLVVNVILLIFIIIVVDEVFEVYTFLCWVFRNCTISLRRFKDFLHVLLQLRLWYGQNNRAQYVFS